MLSGLPLQMNRLQTVHLNEVDAWLGKRWITTLATLQWLQMHCTWQC